ncbi:MAG: 3-oxoacyl-[acyl-carrier-protein] reductase [Candidatus Kapabacteria bacterium]|jgi:3-oxoacyl-[acyl-carrier protein] reductase|nr:3-oxoacyl-[acyl-carrier-protein] reductase [Candidatus Kapabacteria bacterium]
MKRFEGPTAIVTGGCRGIGQAMVEKFASEGATVYAMDYVSPDNGSDYIENEALRPSVKCIQADVSSEESVNAAIKTIVDESGQIDILVNNAGITRDGLVMRMSEQQWDAVLNTNLKGAFLCSKAVCRPMMSKRKGRIINIGSIVGTIGNAGQANYSASKAGMIGMTKSMAKEFGSRNILVNLIAPGYVMTKMTDELNEDQKNAFLEHIPLKRGATPNDIANVAAFLASEDSSYMTGQVLRVDGGLEM